MRTITKVGYVKLVTDGLFLTGCFFLSMQLSGRGILESDIIILIVLLSGWYFSTKISNLYDEFRTETFVGELLLILQNVVIQVFIAGQLFFLLNQSNFARTFVLYYASSILIALIVKNYVTKKALLHYRQGGGNTRYVMFVGYNKITDDLISRIENNPHYGMKVLGVISNEENSSDFSYLKELEKFHNNNDNVTIDDIIVTSDLLNKDMLQGLYKCCESKGVRLKFVPNYSNYYLNRVQFQLFGNYPLITLRSEPLQQAHWLFLKRAFDIAFSSLVFLLIFSWLFPIIAILIKLNSKGPVFFKQDRWGENGKKFKCYKFRSMVVDSQDVKKSGAFNQATQNDPRITKIGAFLRKTSLDEFPQFINVLKGEMSVVGPRPHAHEHNLRTKDLIDKYMIRHWVKPGITGWAQVNGYRGETKTNEAMQKRIDFDIHYIETWTFWSDLKIILMTVYNMAKGEENAY
ncbi:undecaprenyl-phosphate glucose phosphotransferase [Arcticibacterium luteifluviistationis]|uniref:Undecaprenyl-phosphate glucose phosphotransferase n=1 Tax=Arcticibacterium luteifluviistationis TaxID=1784714 RepID=A0A2Z4GAR7_9BACT|nr:undecaprenyl-phosphate glucose phosphotransferase [Arcticibacterium luteifluviistationis]AWV98033.1 undecaprenyl-phosphate glucose phosphotransferase [Arcticibacterium luteifluviistationis]